MIQLLKINLIIFIILSFPVLGNTNNQNQKENLNTWKQSTKSYIKNFNGLTGAFTQIDHVGNISKGNFWVNNKNEIAFHYSPPSETIIIYKSGKLFFEKTNHDSWPFLKVCHMYSLVCTETECARGSRHSRLDFNLNLALTKNCGTSNSSTDGTPRK